MRLRSTRVVRRGRKPVMPESDRATQRMRCAREVCAVDDPFFAKETRVRGIPIRAAACVEDAALTVAADRMSRQLCGLPQSVINRLVALDASVHIIGRGQATSDLPEHAHMRNVRGGYTKEDDITVDQRTRGMGGLKSSCGEENLLNIDDDPCYAGRDILTHEFAHAIMDYGLPRAVVDAIRAQHAAAVEAGLWRRPDGALAYAGSNASEYWAELSMWYFGSHGEWVDATARAPAVGPAALAAYDRAGFELLGAVYNGSHAAYAAGDDGQDTLIRVLNTTPIDPIPADAPSDVLVSVNADGDPSTLVFRNSSAVDHELLWVDPSGDAHVYGRVPAGSSTVQNTYAGHVWRLVALPRAGAPAPAPPPQDLHYCAPAGACLVVLGADGSAAERAAGGSTDVASDKKKARRGRRGARGRGGGKGKGGGAELAEPLAVLSSPASAEMAAPLVVGGPAAA